MDNSSEESSTVKSAKSLPSEIPLIVSSVKLNTPAVEVKPAPAKVESSLTGKIPPSVRPIPTSLLALLTVRPSLPVTDKFSSFKSIAICEASLPESMVNVAVPTCAST